MDISFLRFSRLGMRERFRHFGLGDNYHSLFGDGEAALLVELDVIADGGVRRDVDFLVDDGLANAAVPADVDAGEQDRAVDLGVAVDADVGGEDGTTHVPAADDTALADHAVVGL